MVTVAQLVEPWTVTPVVAGSNPVSHPICLLGFICNLLQFLKLSLKLSYKLIFTYCFKVPQRLSGSQILWLEPGLVLKTHDFL
jgi:hypothetical protein